MNAVSEHLAHFDIGGIFLGICNLGWIVCLCFRVSMHQEKEISKLVIGIHLKILGKVIDLRSTTMRAERLESQNLDFLENQVEKFLAVFPAMVMHAQP